MSGMAGEGRSVATRNDLAGDQTCILSMGVFRGSIQRLLLSSSTAAPSSLSPGSVAKYLSVS